MSQILKVLSEIRSSSRSVRSRLLILITSNNDKIELDQDTFQNHELKIQELENRLVNWSMLEIKLKEIYKLARLIIIVKKIFILLNLLSLYVINMKLITYLT